MNCHRRHLVTISLLLCLSLILHLAKTEPEPRGRGSRGRGRLFDEDKFGKAYDENEIQKKESSREEKLLNIFQVVRFPNDACNTTTGDQGVCYTSAECTARSGSNAGSCASGFGVCCAFSIGCGGMTSQNNTYFVSGADDTSPCSVMICKLNSDICQIRLDFDTFNIAQPDSTAVTNGDTTPQPTTQCLNAQFSAQSEGHIAPVLCGTNTGQHMILEAKDDCNSMYMSWFTNIGPRNWKIKISQISCKDPHKPPSGCTQYYTGVSGSFQSYNWQGGIHLANQNYLICFRQEQNMCKVQFSDAPGQFEISHTAGIAEVGDICSRDYLHIPGGRWEDEADGFGHERYCGALFEAVTDIVTGIAQFGIKTITTARVPFAVRFVTDGGETSNTAANAVQRDELSKGFLIDYKQGSSNCLI